MDLWLYTYNLLNKMNSEIDQILLHKLLCSCDDYYSDREIYGYFSDDGKKITISSWIPKSLESFGSESIDVFKYTKMLACNRKIKLGKI